jgi:hypothetical protein
MDLKRVQPLACEQLSIEAHVFLLEYGFALGRPDRPDDLSSHDGHIQIGIARGVFDYHRNKLPASRQ